MALTHEYGHSYNPGTIAIYQKIFDTAWQHLVSKSDPLVSPGFAALTREALAQHIIACGRSGMRGDEIMNSVFDQIIASQRED